MSDWRYARPTPDPTLQWNKYTLWCQNPACNHSRRPHPITGWVTHGGRYSPDESGPEVCEECGSELDTQPLFETDEPYISEEWE